MIKILNLFLENGKDTEFFSTILEKSQAKQRVDNWWRVAECMH